MKKMNGWLLIGIIGVAVFGTHFVIQYGRAMWGSKDMWWTPKSMALPIDKTRHEFELILNDELLQSHLDRGSMSATDRQGQSYRVVPEDIVVRLNNWNRTKASFLHAAVFTAFLLGASVTSLVTGITQWLAKRKATAAGLAGRSQG